MNNDFELNYKELFICILSSLILFYFNNILYIFEKIYKYNNNKEIEIIICFDDIISFLYISFNNFNFLNLFNKLKFIEINISFILCHKDIVIFISNLLNKKSKIFYIYNKNIFLIFLFSKLYIYFKILISLSKIYLKIKLI